MNTKHNTVPEEGTEAATDLAAQLDHCFGKMVELVRNSKDFESMPSKELFQVGYNAGRLGELTPLGRKVWDALKTFVETNDRLGFLDKLSEIEWCVKTPPEIGDGN